jgi:hypothetical protein
MKTLMFQSCQVNTGVYKSQHQVLDVVLCMEQFKSFDSVTQLSLYNSKQIVKLEIQANHSVHL